MTTLILVMVGGAVGSGLRYGISAGLERMLGAVFPWGTMMVNVTGSFAIAAVMTLLGPSGPVLAPELRAFLTMGVLGGFTTFSSFSWQTMALFEDRQFAAAWFNIAGSVTLCLLAALAGVWTARWLEGGAWR